MAKLTVKLTEVEIKHYAEEFDMFEATVCNISKGTLTAQYKEVKEWITVYVDSKGERCGAWDYAVKLYKLYKAQGGKRIIESVESEIQAEGWTAFNPQAEEQKATEEFVNSIINYELTDAEDFASEYGLGVTPAMELEAEEKEAEKKATRKISLRNLTEKQQDALKGLLYWTWELAVLKTYGNGSDLEALRQAKANIIYNKQVCNDFGVPTVYQSMVLNRTNAGTDYTNLSEVIGL